MKLPFAILLAVAGSGVALTATPAAARDGCGRGMERGPHGRCHAIGRGWGRDQVWVVGRYYNGRGWWDGHRWYQNRYRHHGGWRYR